MNLDKVKAGAEAAQHRAEEAVKTYGQRALSEDEMAPGAVVLREGLSQLSPILERATTALECIVDQLSDLLDLQRRQTDCMEWSVSNQENEPSAAEKLQEATAAVFAQFGGFGQDIDPPSDSDES